MGCSHSTYCPNRVSLRHKHHIQPEPSLKSASPTSGLMPLESNPPQQRIEPTTPVLVRTKHSTRTNPTTPKRTSSSSGFNPYA